MAKKAQKTYTVDEVAALVGLTTHHTRRLINSLVGSEGLSRQAGRIVLSEAQVGRFAKARLPEAEKKAVELKAELMTLRKLAKKAG